MRLWAPSVIELPATDEQLAQQLRAVPAAPGVFVVSIRGGGYYAGRSADLQRRLRRLLAPQPQGSKLPELRTIASRLSWQRTASRLENLLLLREVTREYFPQDYLRRLRLRMPAYVKVVLSNAFPRTQVTTRLTASPGLLFGPFTTRAAAEAFESRFLDLFQIRRCREDLEPRPDHPGCIYGEMNLCLRPCQQVVSESEYAAEVHRAMRFLSTAGMSLLEALVSARERASEELDFEMAARLHKEIEKVHSALRLREELSADVDSQRGLAVTASTEAGCVELWFFWEGWWQAPVRFKARDESPRPVSMDSRLRQVVSTMRFERGTLQRRQEDLALLVRWYYGADRDGEWIQLESLEKFPYRKVVHAISKVTSGAVV